MKLQLRKAERKQAKLRVGISGASGAGKTYSALLVARGMAEDWDKIALIDTESGSGELYAHLGAYNIITLGAPFTPERYIEAIAACEDAGMRVIIIDSATQEWDGKGGCLEIVDQLGGKYQDWAKVTPRHRKFIEALTNSSAHIIVTMRRKQDYEMTKGGDGKVKVEKVGMKEIQREGFEYELTINFELDQRHNTKASKDRTGLFMDRPEFIIGTQTGEELKVWNEGGAPALKTHDEKKQEIAALLKDLGTTIKGLAREEVEKIIKGLTGLDLEPENFDDIIARLDLLKTERAETKGKVAGKEKATAQL